MVSRVKNPLDDAETLTFDDNFNLVNIGEKQKIIKKLWPNI